MFPSWWRKLVNWANFNGTRSSGRKRRQSASPHPIYLPRVERFEDRIVPTMLSIPTTLTAIRGSILTVPVNVDTLNDTTNANAGLSGADFTIFYDTTVFSVSSGDVSLGTISTNGSTALGDGYSPTAANGWTVTVNSSVAGNLIIGLSNGGSGIITNTGGGSLVTINFHVNAGAPSGPSNIDLAADTLGVSPVTDLGDQNFNSYTLMPAPVDNAVPGPGYTYIGSDPCDGAVDIAGPYFTVAAPASATVGSAFDITVTAQNTDGTTNTGYTGTVHFAKSDAAAGSAIPADYKFVAADSGVHVFTSGVTLVSTGYQAITATDTVTATTTGNAAVSVSAAGAAATHFGVTAPVSINAGMTFTITVTALTAVNTSATAYAGTVHFSSTDTNAATLLPADSTFTNGVGIFTVTLKTPGDQTLTATDTVSSSLAGTSAAITVTNNAATHFALSAPGLIAVGSAFSLTVNALDVIGTATANYSGTVHFTSTDSKAVLPADATLTNGVGIFTTVMLRTLGSQTISATDTVTSSITVTSSALSVAATAGATQIAIASSASTSAFGQKVTFTATVTGTPTFGPGLAASYYNLSSVPSNPRLSDFFDLASGARTSLASLVATRVDANIDVPTNTSGFVPSPTITSLQTQEVAAEWSGLLQITTGGSYTFFSPSDDGSRLYIDGNLVVNNDGLRIVTTPPGTTQHNPITLSAGLHTFLEFYFNNLLTGGVIVSYQGKDTNNTVKVIPASVLFHNYPVGTVTFYDNGIKIGTGLLSTIAGVPTAAFGTTTLTLGSHTISATYATDGYFLASSSTLAVYQVVTAASTTTAVSTTPNPSVLGQSVTITATVSSSIASGLTASYYNLSVAPTGVGTAFSLPSGKKTSNATLFVTRIDNRVDVPYNGNGFGPPNPVTDGLGNVLQKQNVAVKWSGLLQIAVAGKYTFYSPSDDGSVLYIDGTEVVDNDGIHVDQDGTSTAIKLSAGLHTLLELYIDGPLAGAVKIDYLGPDTNSARKTIPASVLFHNPGGSVQFVIDGVNFGSPVAISGGTASITLSSLTLGNHVVTAFYTGNSEYLASDNNAAPFVQAVVAPHLAISIPASATAGTAFNVTVTAQDAGNNTFTGYTGTVHFTSSDGQAVVHADATLVNGVGIFAVTLKTAGSQTVGASDVSGITLPATSNASTVNPAKATHFVLGVPASTLAGNALLCAVTAEDQFNNIALSYGGTIHFSSTDNQAQVPANTTLTNGVGVFPVVLKTAGNQTITAVDAITITIGGTSAAIAVIVGGVTHIGVTGPASAATGSPISFTVRALDANNNVITGYSGTVHFASSDPAAFLPANSTLNGGTGTFSVTLQTVGNQILSASDTTITSIAGSSSLITVRGLIVTALTPTPTGFSVQFNKAFDPSTLNLYDGVGTFGQADVTVVGPAGSVRGSLLLDPTNMAMTFIKTGVGTTGNFGVLAAGTYTVTLRSAANGFRDSSGSLLDGNSDGTPGDNFVTTFTVASSTGPVLSIPDFARGPNGTANIALPNATGTGIPITLASATGVTDLTFTLTYNPAFLNISGTLSGPAGSSFTLASNVAGVASFHFKLGSAAALGSAATLGQIVAQVPNSAAASSYKAKELLHLGNIVINGSITTARNDDGVHVVAYLGDVSGDGTYSSADASLNGRVATSFDSGFAAYPLLDPTIVGDVNLSNSVDSTDVTVMNRRVAGIAQSLIPSIPSNLNITPTGPDPVLSLPAHLDLLSGATEIVPLNIDTAKPDGSTGITEAILALRFDPRIFSVSAADVRLGTLPAAGSGWTLQTVVNAQTGEIGIDLFSSTPLQTTSGGSLVTIAMHLRDTALVGSAGLSIVNQVNPTGGRAFQTTLSDAQGALVLHISVAPTGNEPVAPAPVNNGQRKAKVAPTVSGAPWAVDGEHNLSFATTADHQPPNIYSAMEQVFSDQENVFVDDSAVSVLPTASCPLPIIDVTDQGLLNPVGLAQDDWDY